MRKVIIFSLLLISLESFGQFGKNFTNSKALNLYNSGLEAYTNNEIVKADSLFKESLSLEVTNNCIYNYATTRLLLKDTCTACRYYNASRNFNDDQAEKQYNSICLKHHDTLFFDSNYQKIKNHKKYVYFEEFIQPRCDTISFILIHKKNHKSQQVVFDLKEKIVDVFATAILIDTVRYYNYISSSSFESGNRMKLDSYEENITKSLNTKYDFSKIPNNKRYFTVTIYVNKRGRINKCTIEENPFDSFDNETKALIKKDILYSILTLPRLTPSSFMDEPVSTIFSWMIGL